MRIEGQRQSTNIEDRRGRRMGGPAGIGGGGSLTRIFRFRRGVCVGRAISIFGVRRSAVVFYQFVFFFFTFVFLIALLNERLDVTNT